MLMLLHPEHLTASEDSPCTSYEVGNIPPHLPLQEEGCSHFRHETISLQRLLNAGATLTQQTRYVLPRIVCWRL